MNNLKKWNQRTLMKISLFLLYFVHQANGFRVINNARQYDKKPRFYSSAQLDKVQRFLQRRYAIARQNGCLLYTSPSPRDKRQSRMPSSA